MDRKTQLEALAQALQERRATFEVQSIVEACTLLLDGLKDKLLTCTRDEFERLQGEAQGYDRLIRLITRPSLKTQQPKER